MLSPAPGQFAHFVSRLVAALGCAILAAIAIAAAPPSATAELLSNERTMSIWAHPTSRADILSAPRHNARKVSRLHWLTEMLNPEVYLALRSRVDHHGHRWIKIRVPERPNGKTGWVRRNDLGPFHHVGTRLEIDKSALRATLYRGGEPIWSSIAGVGKPSTPTPEGHFYVRELMPNPGGIYGSAAFGTSAYASVSDWPQGGVVGVHGTNTPWLLPGTVSNGCIRLPNGAAAKLARKMPIGTPIRIF